MHMQSNLFSLQLFSLATTRSCHPFTGRFIHSHFERSSLSLPPRRYTINETSNGEFANSLCGTPEKIFATDADQAEHDFRRGRNPRQLRSRVQREAMHHPSR